MRRTHSPGSAAPRLEERQCGRTRGPLRAHRDRRRRPRLGDAHERPADQPRNPRAARTADHPDHRSHQGHPRPHPAAACRRRHRPRDHAHRRQLAPTLRRTADQSRAGTPAHVADCARACTAIGAARFLEEQPARRSTFRANRHTRHRRNLALDSLGTNTHRYTTTRGCVVCQVVRRALRSGVHYSCELRCRLVRGS
jgi:hypothetical protein